MRFGPRSLFVCAAGAAFAWASVASGQTIQISGTPSREQTAPTGSGYQLYIASAQCLADDEFTFQVIAPLGATGVIEAFTGENCVDATSRASACRKISGEPITPSTTAQPFRLRAQDLVLSTPSAEYVAGGSDGCTAGSQAPAPVNLWFLQMNGSTVLDYLNYTQVYYDVGGPSAPGSVKAGAGERRLIVDFSGSSAPDRASYRFYCDPPPGAAADGGAAGDGGAEPSDGGAEAGVPAACGSGLLVGGAQPDERYFCGSVAGKTATSGEATGLANGVTYAVAVAGVDALGNRGPLSQVVCGTPQEVAGFFELYRAAGGEGGGGFCALAPGRPRGRTAALWGALLVGCALGAARRRRQ
ncbi:MAG: hypothetical protein IT376_07525 [Polyangiaceae bacterium]|nr:hypothetical protein [Polyangiaceae bacterium]